MHKSGRFDILAEAPNEKLANLPKGTLPTRTMTSRQGGYDPFSVRIDNKPNWSAQQQQKPSHLQTFYSAQNKQQIVKAVLKAVNKNREHQLKAHHIPSQMVTESMRFAFEAFGKTVDNASGVMVGPSASLPWQAPAEKFALKQPPVNMERMNQYAIRRLQEQIMSERSLLSRYHRDLGGAVHVLDYPHLPKDNSLLLNPYY